jgi:hypothetical protein
MAAVGVAVVLGSAVGVAGAGVGPPMSWAPTTSSGAENYGTVTVGQTAAQTFTLTAPSGTGVLSISVTGAAAFAIAKDGCTGTTLAAGALCRVTVTYAPGTGADTSSATLTATSTKPAATTSVALTGAGAKASPGLATAPSAIGSGDAGGTAVTDTVALAGGDQPGGQIEFQLFGPSKSPSCPAGTAVFDKTVPVNGNGTYTSPSYTPATAGSYWWTAAYNGDGNNTTAASNCGDETVSISPPPATPHLYWADQGTDAIMESNLDGTGVTTLVSNLTEPGGVAVDSSHIYWTDANGINEANLDGSNPQLLVSAQNAQNASGIAVDGSHIYWASYTGSIKESNLDGTGVTTLVSNQDDPEGVAVDGGHIYWANYLADAQQGGTINEANLDGSGMTTLVTTQPGFYPEGVAVEGSHIIWATNTQYCQQQGSCPGTIMASNLDGSGVTTLVSHTTVPPTCDHTGCETTDFSPIGVAADASHIFWSDLGNKAITADNLVSGESYIVSPSVATQVSPQFMAVGG